MNYQKPVKLLPLQFLCPFQSRKQNARLISRDEIRLIRREDIKNKSILDTCVKSFTRMYYQPAIRYTSFHDSKVTGKVRQPRRLTPINGHSYSEKLSEKNESLHYSIQSEAKLTINNPLYNSNKEDDANYIATEENLKDMYEEIDEIAKINENKGEMFENNKFHDEIKDINAEKYEIKKEKIEIKDETNEIIDKKREIQLKDPEKASIEVKNIVKKERITINNKRLTAEVSDGMLSIISLQIFIKELNTTIEFPLNTLEHILFTSINNIKANIINCLRIDINPSIHLYKDSTITEYTNISENYIFSTVKN